LVKIHLYVSDEYHLVDGKSIQDLMVFLLTALSLHGRKDPFIYYDSPNTTFCPFTLTVA